LYICEQDLQKRERGERGTRIYFFFQKIKKRKKKTKNPKINEKNNSFLSAFFILLINKGQIGKRK